MTSDRGSVMGRVAVVPRAGLRRARAAIPFCVWGLSGPQWGHDVVSAPPTSQMHLDPVQFSLPPLSLQFASIIPQVYLKSTPSVTKDALERGSTPPTPQPWKYQPAYLSILMAPPPPHGPQLLSSWPQPQTSMAFLTDSNRP